VACAQFMLTRNGGAGRKLAFDDAVQQLVGHYAYQ
jgi:hypothetical protein